MHTKIKQFRQKAGLSQEELANKSGVSRTIIYSLENNKAEVTTNITMRKIANALNASVAEIFFDD